MATLDVFSGDGFSLLELTDAINKVPYQPGFLGSLGLFEPRPVRTDHFAVEEKNGTLALVQHSPRGAPLDERANETRKLRRFDTIRLAKKDRLTASEISGIRAFGSESEFQSVQKETMERMIRLRGDIELTLEYMRLGAIFGDVLDAAGTSIYNWFTEFSISQAAEVDFDLDAASPASGVVRTKCNAIVRAMRRAALGGWVDGRTYAAGICGDTFFDQLVAHSEVRSTYLNQSEAKELREGAAFSQVTYGGIRFVNYRGTDDDSTVSVGATKCKFFPVGGNGVFQHAMSPGESFDLVNTPGQPFYAMTIPDRDRNSYVDIEVYSYPMFVCTRPGMLLRAKNT
jgi:hypothetical protein